MQLRWPAPAKLNLDLRVVGKRADGYHLLDTVFRMIDVCDRLRFEVRRDGRVRRVNDVAGVPEAQDLVVRAARLLQEAAGCALGADIHVDKVLPMGGGLGGGSSDAATALMALNHLWRTGLGREELMALGLRLGADVPFFIYGQTARAQGVGEELSPFAVPPAWYVVLVPPVHVPTAAVFAGLKLTEARRYDRMAVFPDAPANDLQAVAVRKFPVIGAHLEWLGQYGPALMTGSGCCVFAPFGTEAQARTVLGALPDSMRGFVARGLDRHPAEALLSQEG